MNAQQSAAVEGVLHLAASRRLATTGEGKRTRLAAGLSLREVADPIGVDPATLWHWENGLRAPRGDRAIAWALLLEELAKEGSAA